VKASNARPAQRRIARCHHVIERHIRCGAPFRTFADNRVIQPARSVRLRISRSEDRHYRNAERSGCAEDFRAYAER